MDMKHSSKQLTSETLKELLHYNPETGIFTWAKNAGQRAQVGRIAGSRTPSGYIKISLSRKLYAAHRLAWLYMTGSWPENEIDHNQALTEQQGVPVMADCKRCSGRGYERIPSTEAYAAVCQITDAISLDTWKKSVKPFYDQLITKFDIEEAWAETQLKQITK